MNSLRREIITTDDGSVTIRLPEWDETYHSKFGAVQESRHVFIQNGLSLFAGQPVSILEIGFGTGLNAFITYLETEGKGQEIYYAAVEAFPLSANEVSLLNYAHAMQVPEKDFVLRKLHESSWDEVSYISDHFTLEKHKMLFEDVGFENRFDLIYFDAFGYDVQPELWSVEIFSSMQKALKSKGILVTYAARSAIKINMQAAGFTVEKIPGPPGKREMMRAAK